LFDLSTHRYYKLVSLSLTDSEGRPAPITAVAMSPDMTRVVAGITDGSLRLVSVSGAPSLVELRSFKAHSSRVNAISFGPDGDAFSTVSVDCTVRLWEFSTCETAATAAASNLFTVKSEGKDVTFFAEGALLCVGLQVIFSMLAKLGG
jgi:WD40 repeat protein